MKPPGIRLVADHVVLALAREIEDGDVVGVGLGTPLAVVAGLLARLTHAPGSHVLVAGAIDPDADLGTCLNGPRALLGRTCGYVSHLDTMDMAERQAMTVQFLRPAQIDGSGAANTSRIGSPDRPRVRLPGGLATGDVPSLLRRLVFYLPEHRPRSLPDVVSFRTSGGGGWSGPGPESLGPVAIVTTLGVFRFTDTGVRLTSVHPWADPEWVRRRTGFGFSVDDGLTVTPGPEEEERAALATVDPDGLRERFVDPPDPTEAPGVVQVGR